MMLRSGNDGWTVMDAGRNLMVVLGFVLAGAGGAFAGADTQPVIVVPGRPGVPVMVDGQDVSGAVLEGEWGLAREHAGITIIRPGPPVDPGYPGRNPPPQALRGQISGGFFPGTGRKPRLGRDEVIPPADRPLPPKAEPFRRGWGSESPGFPASIGQSPFPLPLVGVDIDWQSRRHGPRQTPDR